MRYLKLERIKENIKSLDINISPEDMTKIATLDSHTRMTDGSAWIFPDGPYTMKNIWDEKWSSQKNWNVWDFFINFVHQRFQILRRC